MSETFRAVPNGTIRLTAATVSGSAPVLMGLPTGGGCTALVQNRGTVPVLVEFGTKATMALPAVPSDTVAGSRSIPVGGVTLVRLQQGERHVAIAVASGTPDVEITVGDGSGDVFAVPGAGGGGGSANPYPGSDYAKDGTDPTSPVVAQDAGGTGSRGWLAKIAGLLKLGTQNKANSGSVTIATDQGNLEPGGTSITGASMPTGGVGLTGWLSAIWQACTAATPAGTNVIGFTALRSAGTNRSLSASTTAAQAMAANSSRQGWKIKNDTAIDVWINFDGTATAAAGGGNIKIAAGAYMASEPAFCETGAMSIIAASSTPAITIREH